MHGVVLSVPEYVPTADLAGRTGRLPVWLTRFVPLVPMSLARLEWSTSVRSRIMWSFLLCAVALGIVGMHGLTPGGGASQSMGHHVAQAVDMVPASTTPDSPAVNDSSPSEHAGLLTLCLMVLIPVVAVGLLLLVGSRVGGWHLRRQPVLAMLASELAVPPRPLWRQLGVLRI